MGKSELYLDIRDDLSIPILTQKIYCNCHFIVNKRKIYADSRKAPIGNPELYFAYVKGFQSGPDAEDA